jgi:BirA family biotin operon repressor/biotin-[acetyl-CoA-carboxylase] ligase
LNTSYFGRYLHVLAEVDSTNKHAHQLAREGAPEGTIVVADHQTSGKGQRGNVWYSSPGKNILLSLILRPHLEASAVQNVTLATANIIVNSLDRFLILEKSEGIELNLKWPNDIMVGDRKLAGILIESAVRNKWIDFLVIGVGINVNQDIGKLPEDLRDQATSIQAETGRKFDREKLIAQLISDFERNYIRFARTDYGTVIYEWKQRCRHLGKTYRIETPLGIEQGKILDINEQGMLVYENKAGEQKRLVSGRILNG